MADGTNRRSSRFSMRSKQIGQLLQEAGEVKAEHIAKALKIQEQQGGLIGQILRSMGVCKPSGVREALLKQVQVTDIHCEDLTPEPRVLGMVGREQCDADKLCPFELVEGLLCVVMGNPLNRRAINAIEEATKVKVKPFKAPWPRIKELIDRSYTEENMAAAGDDGALEPAGEEDDGGLAVEELDANPPAEIPAPDFGSDGQTVAEDVAEAEPAEAAEPAAEEFIEGLENLQDDKAEMIETDGRGLTRRKRADDDRDEAPKPKAPKVAKVNVNLDELDLNEASEVVGEEEDEEEEQLEEITGAPAARPAPARQAAAKSKPAAPAAKVEPFAEFQVVPDAYFYEDGAAPEEGAERSEEFLDLIEQLPIAEVVAESAADYRTMLEEKQKAAAPKPAPAPAAKPAAPAGKPMPVESTAAPRDPVAAVALSEAEFSQLVAALEPDPVGEWDWQYAAPGPVPAEEYETEAA
ncbi:MAG: hypothetical protein KIS92_24245 [Planctomycetota bacterium]|nr:hypothetical protein [Planctomycetota bacterium]